METLVKDIHHDLITKCKTDDRKAQFEIYKLYSKAMYNICTRMMANQENAKDTLQEAFISAFHNIKSYRNDSTFGAWLKRIVVNQCVKHLKKQQKLSETEFDKFELVNEPHPENEFEPDPKIIQEAIKKLPTKSRTVWTLYCLEGYDHQEISEILNVSVGTSKSQYNYAKKLLKDQLQKVLS